MSDFSIFEEREIEENYAAGRSQSAIIKFRVINRSGKIWNFLKNSSNSFASPFPETLLKAGLAYDFDNAAQKCAWKI